MLSGRWAVPVADPAADAGLPLGGLSPSAPLVFEVLPGDVQVARLTADLTRSGRPPRWVRLAPYDLDRSALDALAAAALTGTDGTGSAGPTPGHRPAGIEPVVVESDDRRQADRFLSRLGRLEPARPPPPAVLLHYVQAGRNGADRPRLRESVLAAGRRLPAGELANLVERSPGLGDLTAQVAARLVRDVPPPAATVLGFVALLGYWHGRFASLEPVRDYCAGLPWWTDLTGGWRRFEPAWRDTVHAVCGSDRRPQAPLLGRLVSDLVEDGAADAAIELCLDAGYPGTANDLLADLGPDLVAAGRPLSVQRWLGRLPRADRRRHRALAAQVRAASRAGPERPTTPAHQPPGRPSPVGRPLAAPRPAGPGLAARADRLGGSAGSAGSGVAREPLRGRLAPVGAAPLALHARLLGPMDITLGGHHIGQWHGRRGMLLLAYLLLHRERPVPRDTLAVTFWPDAPPDASRNRLHVTLHALRADLRVASPDSVVVFEQGYTINPDVDVRLDTEEFDRVVTRGRRACAEGDAGAALMAYRDAVRQYRGDLLGDHPYEDWTLLPREHYRLRMLDVLGRAAQLAFDTGGYPETVELGQRLLALDRYREDVHRLLMRAFVRLDRPHLAVRQFEACSRQLRRELDMAPARETVELCDRIRARTAV
jgi:DNA-binding SARP family transcriptional activator